MCGVIPSPHPKFALATLTAFGVVAALTLAACGSAGTKTDTGAPASPTTANSKESCAKADGSSTPRHTFAAYPPMCIDATKPYTAIIATTQGTVHIKLRADIAPSTVNSFVNLARYHYFDTTTCHRAVKGFVVQCGDPTASGTGGPGYEFADELTKIEPYKIGSVAMANGGPDTNGSQFFIITGAQGAALGPRYTLFGQVIDSDLGVVSALDAVANPGDGPPVTPINIAKVTIQAG